MPFSSLTRRTVPATAGAGHYDPAWASVDQHPAAPEGTGSALDSPNNHYTIVAV